MEQSRKPLVSIVIPVLNAASYIHDAIKSVINQSFGDWELIVINDGSTDGTVGVVEQTIKDFPQSCITFISRENKGVCRTLNEGFELCRGKYFAYLGADDIWDERKLELQVAELEQTNFGAAFSDCWVIDADGRILSRYGEQYPYHGGDIYPDVVWARFQPASPTVLFLRDAIDSVGRFVEDHKFEDRDLWIRISRHYQVAYIDCPLAYYRVHDANSSSNLECMYLYALDVLERTIADDPSLEPYRGRLIAEINAAQAGAYFEKLNMSQARRYAFETLKQRPNSALAWRSLVLSMLGERAVRWAREKRRAKIAEGALRHYEEQTSAE
jgi:glycosyltransferase involved in cell wall biosynthesis